MIGRVIITTAFFDSDSLARVRYLGVVRRFFGKSCAIWLIVDSRGGFWGKVFSRTSGEESSGCIRLRMWE
jgi:hypothetical protein